MAKREVVVIAKDNKGRNKTFKDLRTNEEMSRSKVNTQINKDIYKTLHTRKINNVVYPVSNPDNSKKNNLG